MKITLVCHYLPPHEGGIERVVARLADGYRNAGLEPVLVAWGDQASAQRASPHVCRALRGWNGLERLGVPVPLLEPLSSWHRVGQAIATSDAVHVHGLPYPASALALLQARRRGLPAVVTEHVGTVPYDSRVLSAVQAVALQVTAAIARSSARAVTVLNDRVAAELTPLLRPLPVVKVANGVDTARFSPVGSPAERDRLRRHFGLVGPTVVSVGRNVAKKGFRYLVQAAHLGDRFEVFLVGAGTSSLSGPRCRAVEAMDQAELADLYRAADLLVLPSEGEGLPLVVQEALASGLPVVMGHDPAVRAELPQGPVRFVDPTDIAMLHRAVCDLLASQDLDAIRVEARREACARYDWDRATQSYLRLLGLPLSPTPGTLAPVQAARA